MFVHKSSIHAVRLTAIELTLKDNVSYTNEIFAVVVVFVFKGSIFLCIEFN